MSSAGIQKLFCGIYSAFKCSFDEFVGEKVFSPSYSSAILAPPSNLTSKEIAVLPEVINSDYKGKIQIMMSSQILWQFRKGDKIAQLLLLPYTFLLTPLILYGQADSAVQIKNNPYGHDWYLNMPDQI